MTDANAEEVTIDPPGAHRSSVIWLHGLGADGHDFEPLVPELRLPGDHGIRFVFPHAPMRPVTVNGGMRMRAWYDIASPDLALREDEAGIRQSAARIERLIAAEVEDGIASERIVLAGFSQGGAVALHTGLRHVHRLAGIVALSAYLPLAERLEAELSHANRDTPILQAHGTEDPIVPITMARHGHARLKAVGAAPEWHEYPMAHAVCAAEIDDVRAWLVRTAGLI